jgi:hypothetical protein
MRGLENVTSIAHAMGSEEFATRLRSGPIRSMLDRVVRSAAEMAGVPYMVLGIRYGEFYEFISTHGVPLTHYSDRVPARLLEPRLFAREVEVADLQKQAQFTALSISPIAKTWRYGGNCPVRIGIVLGDDGVLALSCADTQLRETGGKILTALRQHAEFISDLLWLSHQVQRPGIVADPGAAVTAVLQAAVARFRLPICVIDGDRRVLGQSDTFAAAVRALGGPRPNIGMPIAGAWLTPLLEKAVNEALATQQPRQWLPVSVEGAKRQWLDLFPFSFPELGKFAIFSIHENRYPEQAGGTKANEVAHEGKGDLGSDGAGPVSRFLDETLVPAQRLLRRNETSYVSVRRWRSSIRKHQIAALRALKSDLPDTFVAATAAELARAVRAVYGSPEACVVVPVPCGHSGPGCFSGKLAHALAAELGVTAVDAFEPIAVAKGSSHPRQNGARPSMRLARTVDCPVILVDDVATSGSHIDEAASLLRQSAPSVWPVVWITP